MTTLQERFEAAWKHRLKTLGPGESISQAELARVCGIKAPSVSGWFSGASKNIDGVNLIKAARYLRVRPEWLALGEKPMTDAEPVPAASPTPLEAITLVEAAEALAVHMHDMDDVARAAAAPLLTRMATKPDEAARAIEMLSRLVGLAAQQPRRIRFSAMAVEVAEAVDELSSPEDRRRANIRALSAIGNMPPTGEPDNSEPDEGAGPPNAGAASKPSRSRARSR